MDKLVEDASCQAEEEKVLCQDMETQTEVEEKCNMEAQTIIVETVDEEVLTTMSPILVCHGFLELPVWPSRIMRLASVAGFIFDAY